MELRDGLRIGRGDHCDLVLDDTKVSRQHARFAQEADGWAVTDLESTHGTLLNAERITRHALADGDQIQVGQTVLVFHEGEVPSDVLREVPTADHSGAPHGADARLRIFYDLAGAMAELVDSEALLQKLLDGVIHVLAAERGAVALCEPGGLRMIGRARAVASRLDIAAPGPGERALRPEPRLVIAREVQAATLSRKSAVLVQEPKRGGTLARQQVRTAMAAPLLVRDRVLGLLYVDDRGNAARFSDADLVFLSALGRVCAAALDGAERLQCAAAEAEAARRESRKLVGKCAAMMELRSMLRKIAVANAHIVIHGETGTGKELVALEIHTHSTRAERPFVAVNCAALPRDLVESQLFGHKKGAFTGATEDRNGLFALAHRGTLFLDEIGELATDAQAKVLRAIQEGEVLPVGASHVTRVDIRILTASHKDLRQEVQAGRFRKDLYYRLSVVEVTVPPLRERGDDIALLAREHLAREAKKLLKPLVGFSTEALEAILGHSWPGNVRELHNEVERAVILADGPLVEVWDLSARVRGAPASIGQRREDAPPGSEASLAERFAALEPTERALVRQALSMTNGNLSKAARLLGITRIMMRRRVDRFELQVEDEE